MAQLDFHVRELSFPNTVLISLRGAIDASTSMSFQSTLEQLVTKGVKRFLLDMRGVEYVNSTGMGSLLNLADQMEKVGGGFALVHIHPRVRSVFDAFGLENFFRIFPDLKSAADHFRAFAAEHAKLNAADASQSGETGTATATAPAEPVRPEVGRYAFAYVGGEGVQVTVLRLGPHEDEQALLQITGVDHEWDQRIIRHSLSRAGKGKVSWSTTVGGSEFVTLRTDQEHSGSHYELWVPGFGRSVQLNYDLVASREVNPQHFLTTWLQQGDWQPDTADADPAGEGGVPEGLA